MAVGILKVAGAFADILMGETRRKGYQVLSWLGVALAELRRESRKAQAVELAFVLLT